MPLLDPQVYPVSYDDNKRLTTTDIRFILNAITVATSIVPRIATVSDLTTALTQGLNWCYPTYVQTSSTNTALEVYAASQPGKCGADSQRQLIKIELDPTKTIAPIYVFILGPKPTETYKTGKLTTSESRKITIHNFYQPVTVSGFRNLRERFATASSPTDTSCYSNKCPIATGTQIAQTLTISDTSINTQESLQDPVIIVGQSRGSSSSSYLVSTTAPRGSSSSRAYLAPPGSSSSQSYKVIPTSVSSSTATASDNDNNADEDTDTTNIRSNSASLKRGGNTIIQNITENSSESSQSYDELKQELAALKQEKVAVTATGTQAQQTASQPTPSKHPETYNPNANFFVNLFAEMHSDLTRIGRGTQVASRA